MNNLNIPIILGTAREGRQSAKVADYVLEQTKQAGYTAELIDVRDYKQPATMPAWEEDDDRTKSWHSKIEQADAYIIAAPEYNRSFPGELKIFLDQAYQQFHRKAAAVCAVSAGGLGGVRVVNALLPVLNELQLTTVRNNVFFSSVKDLFNASGKITDSACGERLSTMLEELNWYAQALKQARG